MLKEIFIHQRRPLINMIQICRTVGALSLKNIFDDMEVSKNIDAYLRYECTESFRKISENGGITSRELDAVMRRLRIHQIADFQRMLNWDLGTLLDYTTVTHHQFIRNDAVTIYNLAQEVAHRHSDVHPELNKAVAAMCSFLDDLMDHMVREEQILFQNIRQLLQNNNQSEKGRYSTFGLINEWVGRMQKEHESVCGDLRRLNELTKNYSAPPDACEWHKSLFKLMREFEACFFMLINIENNILFPKALIEDGEHVRR